MMVILALATDRSLQPSLQVWVPQRILSQCSQRMVRQAPRVHSTLGQLCGPAQVFQTPQLRRDVPEGCKKCGNLQQQLHLHLLGSDPVLHVRLLRRSNLECFGHSAYTSSTTCYVIGNNVINVTLYSISSPMLLIALAVFLGAFYVIHLKSLESKLVVFGE